MNSHNSNSNHNNPNNNNNNNNNNRELINQPTALFNRSMTIHATSAANSHFSRRSSFLISDSSDHRNGSSKKWFDSASKIIKLRSLFKSPKSTTVNHTNITNSSIISIDNCIDDNKKEVVQLKPTVSFNQRQHGSFSRLHSGKSFSTDFKDSWSIIDASTVRFPGTEDRVVVYFTSLRGIRRTFEDCNAVRMIFRGFRVFVDERDLSMDIAYRKEVEELLKEVKNVTLPCVFIKGWYVGGVELIKELNETGELRKILQVLPARDRRYVCEGCGDVRFMVCTNCRGSTKVFDEDDGVVNRCMDCNENGLIRCLECCL